ncbi:hypothetical protein [Olleya aquimaris]|uniref:Outer membrane protein with beta-barrel domain n=1 Tax=Olleya aquimaris TaxID=639310 RepID=A0A327RMB9_9FLAO|nr:hypothetical protein [Olleya aquimaris]RAJ18156.1 hypothetical protein LY08_00430 [Olleya aquimaris]
MKKLVFLLVLTISTYSFAQNTYTVNNETLELKTEVEGTLDLLWNTFDNQFRYFVKTEDGTITELTNAKDNNNKYDNAYQNTLSNITGLDASNTKLTLYSLKQFVNDYNASKNSSYDYDNSKPKLKTRVGVFGGLTNNPFVVNPNNEKVAFFGAELELFQDNPMPKHAGFLNIRTAGDTDEFKYSSTQIALGYRFRFINTSNFNVYAQTKFATYVSSKSSFTYEDSENPGTFFTQDLSSSGFDVPFIFGLGADFKVGNGYITFVYDSLFAAFQDTEDNFPMDVALGYKFNL